jgi:hypothetical protein
LFNSSKEQGRSRTNFGIQNTVVKARIWPFLGTEEIVLYSKPALNLDSSNPVAYRRLLQILRDNPIQQPDGTHAALQDIASKLEACFDELENKKMEAKENLERDMRGVGSSKDGNELELSDRPEYVVPARTASARTASKNSSLVDRPEFVTGFIRPKVRILEYIDCDF